MYIFLECSLIFFLFSPASTPRINPMLFVLSIGKSLCYSYQQPNILMYNHMPMSLEKTSGENTKVQ